ncbi:NADAR family protein [Larsenimonas rhizosphaerae]|uniref:NADAR family protein n=1 Tax=Larsenimonas rhizosphaerae TaxID=2944682 RepID=A0AA41ZIX0_9GAMM|nr:NADAR family protein [Larsenimonas rhizosphaerae]MCX2524733.1 NADAR family protein [Larsenimonas rhizosphaerae]
MTLNSDLNLLKNGLMRKYVRNEVVVVYKTKEAFGGLSNMASGYPLNINDICVLTTEALYQACRFPHMPKIQQEIIGQYNPMISKKISKPYQAFSRPDWNSVRFKVMRWCLRVKLAQNYEEFGGLLLATGNRPIVEQSRKDDYWGAKLVDDVGNVLVGQNVLGRLLMELREKIKKDTENMLYTVRPLNIPDFSLLDQPIGIIKSHKLENRQKNLF